MNCKHVQDLLPLYVGGDLKERREKRVTAHVQSCAECATSAKKYGETLRLMEQYAPPPFSEAAYSGIRQRVLREIKRESIAPTLPQLISSLFRPRITWAFATALLLAISVLAYYFIGNHPKEQQNEQQMVANPGGQSDHSARAPTPDVANTPGAPPALEINAPKSQLNLTVKKAGYPKTKRLAAGPMRLAQQSPIQPATFSSNTSATSKRTLRVEMQTKDQNIRIIWFLTPHTNEGSPKESSKGT